MSRRSSRDSDELSARVFSALGDETRLHLMQRLTDGDSHTITDLAAGTGLSRQAVTKHLRILENAALVSNQKTGRESRFELRAGALESAQGSLASLSKRWDQSLRRLKLFAENSG